ncbi:ceramide synthase 4-like [Eublepharis macularius]|uniref:Ceramide synthase 4-like n=1 Tax=Eublepharis macularius TaxID=481883 RepID=A0AA97JEK6_EUBMA|nr:ceramide synthase 4-like [Eublepharis macularius]
MGVLPLLQWAFPASGQQGEVAVDIPPSSHLLLDIWASGRTVAQLLHDTGIWRSHESELNGLAKQCELQPREVERWFRSRLNQDRPSLTQKFCEVSWKSTFYVTSCIMCLIVLHDDFKELIIHHAATIFLIIYSYCANYLRIGTLVMIIHDASDCFLELAKVFSYLKWRWTCDTLFVVFAISFLFTRLVLFPFKVLYNTYYYFMELYQPFFGYYFMNALLMVLYLVQLFWCYLVIQKVYKVLAHGTIEKDTRSDSEDSEDDEKETS